MNSGKTVCSESLRRDPLDGADIPDGNGDPEAKHCENFNKVLNKFILPLLALCGALVKEKPETEPRQSVA